MLNASAFSSRTELETHVKTLAAPASEALSGTKEELKQLHLSHGQTVHGVRVIANDYEVSTVTPHPKRGEAITRIDGRAIIHKNK